jgi:hypothetical protein
LFVHYRKALCDIRNCIVHPYSNQNDNRKRQYIQLLIEDELAVKNLYEILFILVIGFVYSQLGIELCDTQKDMLVGRKLLWRTS